MGEEVHPSPHRYLNVYRDIMSVVRLPVRKPA